MGRTASDRTGLRRFGWPFATVAGGFTALAYLRRRFQRRRLFLPDRYPNGVWNPKTFGLDAVDCWFTAADGIELHGWWIPHRRARGTVLLCHGNTGSIAHQVGILLHLRGIRANLFAFDYRGYGRSLGSPSERGLFLDVRAAYAYLTERLGRRWRDLVLFGHSLGGAVAIDAALDCPVAGLIAQATFTDVRAAARAAFPGHPLHWAAGRQFRSVDKVGEIKVPKLFVHGTADGTLPPALAEELFERAAEPKELYLVTNGGHNDLHLHGGREYLRRLAAFRDRSLAASPG